MHERTVAIASDHRGFALKKLVIERLIERGAKVVDFGPSDDRRCDAGDFALKVVENLRERPENFGVLICGTGQVMAMTANRFRHVRAALCVDATMARLARAHNNSNILVMGAHISGQEVVMDCLDTFITTDFLGGRYAERCDKLGAIGGV